MILLSVTSSSARGMVERSEANAAAELMMMVMMMIRMDGMVFILMDEQ